jgi:LysM repeat protein
MSLLKNLSLGGVGRILFVVLGLLVVGGLLLAACNGSAGGLNALRSVARSGGIPTPTAGAPAAQPPPPATAAQAPAPAQPAGAQAAAPAPAPAPAQPVAVVPTVQPVIITEAGEVRVQTDGQAVARQVAPVQPQDGISPAPVVDAVPAQSDPNLVCDQRINHTVAPGDNLFRLAVRYRTSTLSIARMNGISNVRKLSVGRSLAIQTCDRTAGPVSGGGGGGGGRRYVVRAGDNLFRIGIRFGTTAEHIRATNGLPGYNISPGQVLVIP